MRLGLHYWGGGIFAKFDLRTSGHDVVSALPESNSETRFLISASQAACKPSSTLPPRLEIKESASASCSSIEKRKRFFQ